jgi:hypothetical protein
MYVRNRNAGLTDGASFPFPLTQIELGEACGMTAVHTNRMLQQLRREEAVSMSMKRVRILDWDRLVEIAEFDPAYLYLDSMGPLSFLPGRANSVRPAA